LSNKRGIRRARKPDHCGACQKPIGPCFNKDERHPAAGIFKDDVEPSVVTGLVRHGCDVEQRFILDNEFKIDALVTAIHKREHVFLPVGLQITQGLDRDDKIQAFITEGSKWPGIGSLLYVEIVGSVSHKMCKAVKAAIERLLDEVEKNRQKDPKPFIKRVRFYEDGNFQELPLGQN
jgi:hypothetical protein